MSGAAGHERRADPKWRAQSRRTRPADVRELASSAIVRTAFHRLAREQRDRIDGAARGDRHVRHHRVVVGVARVFDDRHQAEVDVARLRGGRRSAPARRSAAHVGPGVEALDQRPRVEIADGAEADDRECGATGRSWRSALTPLGTCRSAPSRATGVSEAATMLRRTSSSGARRGPSGASSVAGTLIDVVGAEEQRDLRELGAVRRQSTWTRSTPSAAARASATSRTSS